MALAYETNIAFSSTIQSQKPYNSIIINCYASADDVKSKFISDNEVAVFGEYKVLVFYRQPNVNKESSYKSFTLRKNFCEIVLVDAVDKDNITAELKLQSCNFNYISKSRIRSFWNIEVTGEIKVYCTATNKEGNINNSPNINTPTSNNSSTIKPIEAINSKDAIGTINLSEIINNVNNNIENEEVLSDVRTENTSDSSNNANTRSSQPLEFINSESETYSENVSLDSEDNDDEYNLSSRVWQFEDSESTKLEDLMYMDFESLKKMDKD